jgi:hypothetical protein
MATTTRFLRLTTAAILLAATAPLGCTLLPTQARSVGFAEQAPADARHTISVRLVAPLATRAIAAGLQTNVHHYEFKLWTWTGTLGTDLATGSSANATGTFTNVPDGTYKITVQAFASAGTSQPVSPQVPSTNVATIASGIVTGTPLLVALSLNDAQLDGIHPQLTVISGRPQAEGGLAPDDGGTAGVIHDYTVTRDGVTSTFVWIPHFDAWQLITPSSAGYPGKAPGTWVAAQPGSGTPGTDYRKAEFGGFYAAKYEASHADATNAAAGSSSTLAVRTGVVPWANVTLDQAAMACLHYHPQAHLMTDDEWTALAVHAQINAIAVKGNNQSGGDAGGGVAFTDDPTENGGSPGRVLTGSGPVATSHTGTPAGVYDLNGNVAEWTTSLAKANGTPNWLVDGMTTAQSMPTTANYVDGLLTMPLFARLGVPVLSGTANPDFGDDMASFNAATMDKAIARGGTWTEGDGAGLWSLNGTRQRNFSDSMTGFRPCLRF